VVGGGQRVADAGEADQAVEQMIAVGAAAGDVQAQVDLGRGERGQHRRCDV
jgi:hypothetical protein